MEFVDKLLLPKCFSLTDLVFLAIFVFLFALLLVVGIPVALDNSEFHCHNREISKTKETNLMDDVKTQCLKKYKEKFPVDTIWGLLSVSNLFVLVFSIIYGYVVKDRVETFDRAEARSDENERMVVSVEPNPRDYRKRLGHFSTFCIYIIYLFARIPLLVAFVIFFYTSDIPDQFPCPYYLDTGSNVTVSTSDKLLIIDCDIRAGNKYLFHAFAALDDGAVVLTLWQLGKIIWTGYSDEDFKTDEEFCVVHLLGKRKRAKKMVDKVRGRLSSGYEKKFRGTFEGIHVPFQFFFYHNDGKMSNKERSLSELFKPETSDENQEYPRTICVEGQSGVGKTTLTRELLYKWKKKTYEFLNGKILILLPCYEFKDKTLTLREMLAHGPELSDYDLGIVYQTILSIPKKTVLVFDGLDDIDSTLLGENSSTVNRPNAKCPLFVIFKRLLDGDWLPGATVLTTLRPTASHVFQELRFDRKVKILGFSRAQINGYVSRFCKDKRAKERVCYQINKSTELLSFCYIPAYCYIACLTLEKSNENFRSSDTLKTLTELYARAVKVLKRHHTPYRSNPSPDFFVVSPRDCENLLELEVIAESGTKEGFREYFTASKFVRDLNIDNFLVTPKDPKYHLRMQFVAGLLGDKIKNDKKAGITSDSTCNILGQVKERLQKWILLLKAKTTPEEKNIALVAIKFLYELQDSDTRNSVCSNFLAQEEEELSLNDLNITPADSPALFHFIGSIKNLKRLSFDRCTTMHGGNMYTGMAKSLFMNPTNHSITSFSWHKNFPDVELENLSEAVANEHCKLTELNLPENGIKCIGAKKLSQALKSPRCNIKVLDLAGNEIACDKVCNNRQLIEACNSIEECNSIEDLSEALIDSNCKVTSLNLAANRINDVGVGHLVGALEDENCKITSLSLAENAITNDGVQHLRGALKSRNFKLTSLNLCGCEDIDERVMLDLKNALLGKNCKLHV